MATMPMLPPINTLHTYEVFRHKGLQPNNERLALLGAEVLQFSATVFVWTNSPTATKGELTAGKSYFINQEIKSTWARVYGLREYLNCVVNVDEVRQQEKAQATLFEAYVAALFLEHGLVPLNEWLWMLFRTVGV